LRPQLLDARHEIEPVFVGHDDIGDDEIALPVRHPAPQRRGIAGGADIMAEPSERLAQHRADRAVVIGDENGGGVAHGCTTRVSSSPPAAIGKSTRNTVRRGWLSNSMTPP